MQRRSFRGEAGRPFGTVAALFALILTVALLILWDIARDLTGAADPFHAVPAQARAYWGVLLAAEIVKCVTGGAILLAIWTLAAPIGPRTPRSLAALAFGTVGTVLIGVAAHWYLEAAAWLGDGRVSPMGPLMATLSSAALACYGLWAGLTAIEARDARSLPEWVQGLGLLLAVACVAAALAPGLIFTAVSLSVLWWGSVFAALYRPEDRLA
ncbi:hypothetical protein OF829_11630 [Sphingomonas sp. LB-2]|uniref:hypothetical protein n=1 Tax=Sphingomonas caeni TaxID=2984949 RepID=UPI0022323C3F|nr:hypothetical protein [Sphingomonas caeni]MCW3847891.1 hypothetical protein [Sphingomonas caeni]